jgi:hypothetical protein
MADVHVVPAGEDWAVEVDGQQRSTDGTQRSTPDGVAEQEKGELVVHAEDGSTGEKDSHGNDPRNVPG